jgi:hypothetical protein
LDCHCYDSNGKPLEAAAGKPSKSKKPYKKSGGDEGMAFMQSMFEAYVKSQKKAGKSKKLKKRDYDSCDSSDSEKEIGYGNTGLDVDKHLKIDKPLGTIYLSHKPHPIKVINTALSETTMADEIASETAKTGKVTAVVVIMSIFSSKNANCRALILEMRSLLSKRRKEPIFRKKIPAGQEAFLKNRGKARYRRNWHLNQRN